jgi:hypothetical protein
VVESFFDEEPDDSIGVEDEISSFGIFVSNHAVGQCGLAENWQGTGSNVPTSTMQ